MNGSSSLRTVSSLQVKRQLLLGEINEWIPDVCCRNQCASLVGYEVLRALRAKFLEEARRDVRKQMLLDLVEVGDNDQVFIVVNGIRSCQKLVTSSLDVSNQMLSNVLGRPSANASSTPGRFGGRDGSITMKSGVIAFLKALADDLADEIPNCVDRHLPHGNKKMVYVLYQENVTRYGHRPCKQSHFYTVWKDFCPFIKCRRRHNFTACDTCTAYKEKLLSLARIQGHEAERKEVKHGFRKHLKLIQEERAEYRRVQNLAYDNPSNVLSVIIDGADQAKFVLPRFPTATKRETGTAMQQKVTGVLFHGGVSRQDFSCFFTASDNIPAGANQTIDALCRGLLGLVEKRDASGTRKIPQELHIQLDHTSKDNKNRYFFSFCEYLVHIGLFSSVNVRFLPVGHTHEDIDRKFSRVSVYLRDRKVASVACLHNALRVSQSHKIPPFVSRVEGMLNFSGAVVEQNLITRHVPNMLSYMRYSFTRDEEVPNVNGLKQFTVTTMAGYRMCCRREEMKVLERKRGWVGSFLMRSPNLSSAPPIKLKSFSVEEISQFRKRVRLTEGRIRCRDKVQSLTAEIDRIEDQTEALPDWDFNKIIDLAKREITNPEDISDHEEGGPDATSFYTYDVNDMVTVNCRGSLADATSFWLGRIINVSTNSRKETKLLVRWFELYGRVSRSNSCFSGKYRPMPDSDEAESEIPAESVYVSFEALTTANTIPDFVQRQTRECISPFEED